MKTLTLPASNVSMTSPRNAARTTRAVPHNRQRSRADPMGMKSSITNAMARAGTALSESGSHPHADFSESEAPEVLLARIDALEAINADAARTIENLSQQKANIELNYERVKDDLRNQYRENAQITPLTKERDEFKEKLEKLRIESNSTISSLSSKLTETQANLEKLQGNYKNEKEVNSRLASERDELLERVKVIDELRLVRDQLLAQKAESEATLQKLRKENETLKVTQEKSKGWEDKVKQLENEMRGLKARRVETGASEKIMNLTQELNAVKGREGVLEGEIKSLKETKRNLEATITKLQSENAALNDGVAKSKESLLKAGELQQSQQLTITNLEHQLDLTKVQRDKYSFELSQAQSNLKLVTSETERTVQQFRSEMEALMEEKVQLDNNVAACELKLKQLQSTNDRLEHEKQVLRDERDSLRSLATNNQLTAAQIQQLNEKCVNLDDQLNTAKVDLKSKESHIEALSEKLNKLEKELFEMESERNELKEDNEMKEATITRLNSSVSSSEDTKLQIETSFNQKLSQLEQKNRKLLQSVNQKTAIAEAAETTIASLKESLANSQHRSDYLAKEVDYLQTEIEKIKKQMEDKITDLDDKAAREVDSLSEQLELVAGERTSLITKCDALTAQIKELNEDKKTLNFHLNDLKTEVTSLKEVNADLHTNLEKIEEQKEHLANELSTIRTTNQEKFKKLMEEIETEKREKHKSDEVVIKLKSELASLASINKNLTAAKEEVEETVTELKEKLDKIIQERDDLQMTYGDSAEVIKSITKERDMLQAELSKQSGAQRELDNLREELQKNTNQLQRQTTELEDANREREHLQRRLDRFTRENKELIEDVNSLKEQLDRMRGIEAELRTLRSEKAELHSEYLELSSVRDELSNLKRIHAGLAKENEDLLSQNEEKKQKLGEFERIKAEYEQMKLNVSRQETELMNLEHDLEESLNLTKLQEDDLVKYEEEIKNLKEEMAQLAALNKELEEGISAGQLGSALNGLGDDDPDFDMNKTGLALQQKERALRILQEQNASLERAASTLAMQVTQLCDTLELERAKIRDLETASEDNEQLRKEVKVLESELSAREAEIENILSDNEQLVLKLNSMGLKVKLTDTGITFVSVNDDSFF